jgi:hypothetical protein
MDITTLFEPMINSMKDMLFQIIQICLPYILGIVAVTVVLPFSLRFIKELILGKSVSPYMEQEMSFGQAYYDEDGNLDAVGYGDFEESDAMMYGVDVGGPMGDDRDHAQAFIDEYYGGDYDDMIDADVEDLFDDDERTDFSGNPDANIDIEYDEEEDDEEEGYSDGEGI